MSDESCRKKRENDLILKTQNAEIKISVEDLAKITKEIIDNAFKFSEAGTVVTVETSQTNDYFIAQITDNGRGILPEQIDNIGAYMQFERKIYEQQGMGLGLIIARKLTGLHNGILEIKSEREKTTKVTIYLKYYN